MNIRYAAFAVATICALALTGCGSGTDGSGTTPEVAEIGGLPHTLVGEDYNSVMLLETDTDGADIVGTFDYSQENGIKMDHRHGKVTGTLHGSRVTLTLDLPLGETALKGTLNGTTLTLRAPQANGQVEDYVMKPDTVDYYNLRVSHREESLNPSSSDSVYY